MGKGVVAAAERSNKKKKKAGPPSSSLIHSQPSSPLKRNPNPNPNPNPDFLSSRITRRTVNLTEHKDEDEADDDDDDDDDDVQKKEKKLKLVLRLPLSFGPRTSPNSCGREDVSGSASESEDGEKPVKKRKIESISETKKAAACNGSAGDGGRETRSALKKKNDEKVGSPLPAGAPSAFVSRTPLPNEKLLFFILERFQKKDIYGVFSEPVDPEELPDYHDIIKHPMDFSTMRKKLTTGVYTNLEQFESDVFLICSNAMHYNAPETIYFKQARSIQELAKKNFQSLRQERDDTQQHSKPQRGRPSLFKKFMQQSAGKPTPERGCPESDASLANAGGDHCTWSKNSNDTVKRPSVFDKTSNVADATGKAFLGFHNSETSTFLTEKKNEKNDKNAMLRAVNIRLGKKPLVSEENRRETYKLSSHLAGRQDTVLGSFNMEKKQLMPVGLHMEHAYAWSLARFAADLGPVAWKVAARKIERALPSGMKYGPGWVGEEAPPCRKPATQALSAITAPTVDPKWSVVEMNEPSKKTVQEGAQSPKISSGHLPAVNGNARNLSKENSNTSFDPGMHTMAKLPFQHQKDSAIQQSLNGFTSGFSLPQLVKQGQGNHAMLPVRPTRPPENMVPASTKLGAEAATSTDLLDQVRQKNTLQTRPPKQLEPEEPRPPVEGKVLTHCSNKPNPANTASAMGYDAMQAGSGDRGRPKALWRGMSLHRKPDSVPPDLNIGFQSPGSPGMQNSGVLPDPQQPDLALQL